MFDVIPINRGDTSKIIEFKENFKIHGDWHLFIEKLDGKGGRIPRIKHLNPMRTYRQQAGLYRIFYPAIATSTVNGLACNDIVYGNITIAGTNAYSTITNAMIQPAAVQAEVMDDNEVPVMPVQKRMTLTLAAAAALASTITFRHIDIKALLHNIVFDSTYTILTANISQYYSQYANNKFFGIVRDVEGTWVTAQAILNYNSASLIGTQINASTRTLSGQTVSTDEQIVLTKHILLYQLSGTATTSAGQKDTFLFDYDVSDYNENANSGFRDKY